MYANIISLLYSSVHTLVDLWCCPLVNGWETWGRLDGTLTNNLKKCLHQLNFLSYLTDKIAVGSYHGFLRIYNPRPIKGETGWSGFRAEDVMCETSLPQPILQVRIPRHGQLTNTGRW